MRKLILALAAITMTCGCCRFCREDRYYTPPASPGIPLTVPVGK